MAEIIAFVPKAGLSARVNLDAFVKLCRDKLTVFGAGLDWHSNTWPKVGNFTVKGAPAKGFTEEQYLHPDILPFAKSYVRYQQGVNPTKLVNELKAIRCIEPALLSVKGRADITLVDTTVMDVAASIAREYQASSYQAGTALAKLVRFLNDHNLTTKRIEWRNPIRKPKEINCVDEETQAKRVAKLPEDAHLEAMGEMFANNLQHPRDRFTTSIFALLMCAPSRISEVQRLPLSVLHYGKDTEGVDRLGLRYFSGKGFGWDSKWVIPSYEDIAKEAVRRLTALSEEGRRLARWYEENPSKFYRHDECPNVEEDAPLSDAQVCLALGFDWCGYKANIDKYFKAYAPYTDFRNANRPLTLAFLNDYCHAMLPEGFPYLDKDRGLKYSEALCCYRENEFRESLLTSRVKLWTPGKSLFTTDLNYIQGQKSSIWTRHGYRNPDGSNISMTSHQVRHLLNTASQRGNMGQLDLAKWSGRVNVRQNATYNHMSADEYVKVSEGALPTGIMDKVIQRAPVSLRDLDLASDAMAHLTIFGFCVHDYSMLPCQKHRDCLNCSEHACIKGDAEKLKRLKEHRRLTQDQLDKAKAEDESGTFGADRWSEHQLKTLERLDQLISIMENPEVSEGSVIMLNNDQEYSPLKRELSARKGEGPVLASEPELPLLDFVMDES